MFIFLFHIWSCEDIRKAKINAPDLINPLLFICADSGQTKHGFVCVHLPVYNMQS